MVLMLLPTKKPTADAGPLWLIRCETRRNRRTRCEPRLSILMINPRGISQTLHVSYCTKTSWLRLARFCSPSTALYKNYLKPWDLFRFIRSIVIFCSKLCSVFCYLGKESGPLCQHTRFYWTIHSASWL